MPLWMTGLPLMCLLAAISICCHAQESDSVLTREQWQQRVEEARRRSEDFVAGARTRAAVPSPSPNLTEIEAAERAMRDPSLQQGDIIATNKGLLIFIGRDEQHQPGDFVSAPDQRRPRQ